MIFSDSYSTVVTVLRVCMCRYFSERGDAVAKASKETHVVRKAAPYAKLAVPYYL